MATGKEYYKTYLYSPDMLKYSKKLPNKFSRVSTPKAPPHAYEKYGITYYSDFNTFAERKKLKPDSPRALRFWREYLQRDSLIQDGTYLTARNKVFLKNLQTTISKTFGANKETEKIAREIRLNFNKLSNEEIYKLTTISRDPEPSARGFDDVFALSQLYNAVANDEGASIITSALKELFNRIGKDYTTLTEKDSKEFTPTYVRAVYADISSMVFSPVSESERQEIQFRRQTDELLRRNTYGFTTSEIMSINQLRIAGYSSSQARGIMAEFRAQNSANYKPTLYFTRSGELRGNFLSPEDAKVVYDFFHKKNLY